MKDLNITIEDKILVLKLLMFSVRAVGTMN